MARLLLCSALAWLCSACGFERPETIAPGGQDPAAPTAGRLTRLGAPHRIDVAPSDLVRTRSTGRRVGAGPAHVRRLVGRPREAEPVVVDLGPRAWTTRTPGEDGFAPPRVVDLSSGAGDASPDGAPAPPASRIAGEPARRALEPMRQREGASRDVRYLDVVQGLPAGGIYALHMDGQRRLWLGTNGAGLVRYDGTSAVAYGEGEGLGSDRVWAIAADDAGSLWLATDDGAVHFDGRRFSRYGTRQGLPGSTVNAVLVDRLGRAWLGGEGGLSRVGGDRVTTWTRASGLPGEAVLALMEDGGGRIWIATEAGGVARFDGRSFDVLTDGGLGARRVNDLIEDSRGGIWLATEGAGLAHLAGSTLVRYPTGPASGSDRVRSLMLDRSGTLWAGTDGSGLLSFDGESFSLLDEASGLSDGHVRALLEDPDGLIWIGTYVNGLNRYDPASFRTLRSRDGLSGDRVSALATDASGQLWFGSFGGGVQRFDGSRFHGYDESNGLVDDIVHAIRQDRNGDMWFGTRGGACRFDGDTFTHLTTEDGLAGDIVHTIAEASDGAIWFGTRTGITRFDGRELVSFPISLGLPSEWIYTIREDRSNGLWFGTNGGGVLRWDGKGFDVFGEREGLGSDRVYAIHEDAAGALWLGSRAGLVRLSLGDPAGAVVQNLSTAHGLSNAIVLSVMEDPSGRLWAGTEAGLNLLQASPSGVPGSPRYAIRAFRHADGLGAIDASLNTVALTPEGEIWWGGSAGSTHVALDGFPRGQRVPALRLTGLDLMGRPVDYRAPGEGLVAGPVPPFESLPSSLELPPGLSHLTFHFSATDWIEPHRVEYQYRLDGADPGWGEPSPEGRAEYRNTPHGPLTFRVRARVGGGPWSDPVTFSLTLRPPWWRSAWATAAGVLAGLALVGALHRLRLRALLHRQKELEGTVEDRTAEIQQQRDELARLNQSLVEKNEAIFQKAVTDELTGLYNRSLLLELLAKELANARRYGTALSVVIADIDHFKRINDTLGHLAGDEAIRGVAHLIAREVRSGDFVFRYGGEEFLLLLPGSAVSQAEKVAEKIRLAVEATSFTLAERTWRLTASFGVTDTRSGAAENESQLIARADQALYRAKQAGRNRVHSSTTGDGVG